MNSTISDLTKKLTNMCKKVATTFFIGLQFFFIVAIPVSAGFAINSRDVIAQATSQINYQGKLTNSSGVAVADGTYNMEFKLYTASTSGSLLWTETRTGTDKVQVTNGLFSVMLGSVTSLDGVDFNQPLYLGVNIGGTGSPGWDGEMAPRKTLGSVPSAFTAFTLEGLKKYQFLRSDVINSTSTASTYLKVEQAGAGGIAEFIANASSTLLGLYTANGGQVTIGTSTVNGTNKLTVIGNSYFSSSTFMAVTGGALNIGTSTQFGTNKLAVDGGGYFSGSVGIGTSTPQSKLVVVQGAAPGITISTLQGLFPSMRFERPGQITWDVGMLNSGNTNGNGFDIKDVSNGFTPFSIENSAPTGSLVVRATGRIGIGTTTPFEKLTIAGNASGIFLDSGANRFASIVTGNTTGALLVTAGSDNNATTSVFMINGKGFNGTSLTTRNLFGVQNNGLDVFTITSGGNVGIGTTSPSDKLSVNGGFNLTGALRVNGSAGTGGMVLQTTGSGLTWVATSSLGIVGGGSGSPGGSSGQVQFNSGGTFGGSANFTFDSGNAFLGLGTSTPGARLVVVGTTTSDQIVIGGGTPFANSPAHFGGNINSYLQVNLQNRSNGASASSDFIVSSDIGTDVANYVDLGINSSGFNDPAFTIAGANEGYLYSQSSSLAIGVSSSSASTSLKFFTGGNLAANERMRIDSTGNIGIGLTSPTEKLSVAGNILIGARTDLAATWTKRSNATAGTITTGGTSSIGTTSAMAVFNGSLYVGTSKGNSAEVYRFNGSTWTQISSTTPGAIGTSTTLNIDAISSMTVWNGHLYIGTAETAAAEIYRYNGNSSWTKLSSTTAGAIGGNSTTSAIDSISAMTVHGGRMYIGTSKVNGAEVVRYNGPGLSMQQSWTKVSNITNNTGTIGATANVDAVSVLVSYQGYMYAGTSEGTTGGLYRYDGQGTTGTGFTIIGTAGTFSGTGPAGASTVTGMGSVRTAAVYNGKLYLGIGSVTNAAGTGRVVKWDGNLTAGTNYELVSSSTAGIIAEDIGAQTGIDRIGSMAIYNDDLYVGTFDSTGIAEVYKLDSGDTWTKYSSTTAGTISTSTGAQTTAITGVLSMAVFNDDLWLGTEKATGAEVYSFNMTEGQSYDLAFEANSDNADAIQNGQKNKGWIQFQAEETAYNNTGNINTGKFVLSHGINTVTGAYDLAEDYPTHDDMLAPGDLVSLDTSEKGFVRRAHGKGDKDIIGIYSVNPALRLSQKDPLIDGARAIPVALAGRVPVTVTLENGPIKIGDYLTSSAEPGKAAKATKPGRVIGRALGAYSGIDGEVPSVTVFLGTESISWNDLQNAAKDATALAAGDDVNGISSVADFVDTVNARAEDLVFAILNKADNLAIVISNNLTAITATIQDLFVKTLSILPGGSIALPSGENQIAGVGILSAGATDTFIANTQIEEDSVIYLSPTSDIDTPLYVHKKVPGKGFSVRTKRAMIDTNITFDWFFIKTYKPKNSGDQVMTTVGGSSSSTDPTTITSISTDTQNVTSSGDTDQQDNGTTETGDQVSTGAVDQVGSGSTNSGEDENTGGVSSQSDSSTNTVVAPEATTVESAPVEPPSAPVESPTAPSEPTVTSTTPPEPVSPPVADPAPTT